MTSKLFNYVSKPAMYRTSRVCELFDGWLRINLYSYVEVAEGVWGNRMAASYVVREGTGGGLEFHHTTPCTK